MTAPTHIAFGLLTVAGPFSFFSMPLHRNLPAIACAIIGSMLPDIDSPNSYIGRVLPYASIPIERQWGHRTITSRALKFQFARKRDITRLKPVSQNLSERVKNLLEEILRICEKLEIAKMAYPLIHYLELRRMEQEFTEKRKKIETLKRAHVRFSGTLYIRIL